MYATWSNHLFHGLHFAGGFLLVYWLWPKTLFSGNGLDPTERNVANFMRMVFAVIVIGYALVIVRLFELFSMLTVLVVWTLYRNVFRYSKEYRGGRGAVIAALFFDYTEGKRSLRDDVRTRWRLLVETLQSEWRRRTSSWWTILETAVLLAAVTGAGYIRFYDAFMHAPPGMSDGNVTLLWMKFIDMRELFPQGIYPQGFHITLDTLYKFSFIDSLYILKYMGPFDSILTMLGLHFLVSRLFGSRPAGIVAAAVYGFLGAAIGNGWERETATNSQEFAMVFVFPTLWFYFQYLQKGERRYFWPAFSGFTITGLVHTLIFAYAAMGIVLVTVIHFLFDMRSQWRRVIELAVSSVASGLVSVIPAGIGLLLGRAFQSSSEEFLVSTVQTKVQAPHLIMMDYTALASIAVSLLCSLVLWRRKPLRLAFLFGGLFSLATFLIYYAGGAITNSTMIASRSGDLWGLSLPFAIGVGWAGVFVLLRTLTMFRVVELTTITALLASVPFTVAPVPIVPYKMQWDSSVEQYLHISSEFRPKTWVIFSQEEGYALIEGKGYHDYIAALLSDYDPSYRYLTKFGESKPDYNRPPETFIIEEKEVYRVSQTNSIYRSQKKIYERRENEMVQLRAWIDAYRQANGGIDIYYEDEHIRIYHIHRPETREEQLNKIWNGEGNSP